jgi:cation transport regulator ChaC
VAYRLAEAERAAVLAHLDHREKNGYARHLVDVYVAGGGGDSVRTVQALAFVATEANPEFLGPAPLGVIAAQIRGSSGPSGPNAEYALRLAEALRGLGVPEAEDAHVFGIAASVAALEGR